MIPLLLAASLAVAQPASTETPEAPATEQAPAPEAFDPLGGQEPWRHYRLRNVLHPEIDREFLLRWEPAFRRRNRLGAVGAGVSVAGVVGVVGGFAMLWNTGNAAGPALMLVGAGCVAGGPILGITGTLSAAKILRAGGVNVSRVWAYAGIASYGLSAFGYTALLTWPLSWVLPLGQAFANFQAFDQAVYGERRFVQVAPLVLPEGGGLSLQGRW